jgi:hypothetical protein
MSKEWFPLDKIKVAAPCTADWRLMYGNERVRFCGQCSQYVYNLSAMTKEQAEDLILRHEGRLCVRFYKRKDGTIISNNCPVGLRALKAKYTSTKATILKAAMMFLAYLGVLWWVEGPPIVSSVQGGIDLPNGHGIDQEKLRILESFSIPRLVTRSEQYIRERAIYKAMPVAHTDGGKPVRGDAVVKIVILASGAVEKSTLIKGPDSIREITEGAALRWKFEPMTEGGKPVRVESMLTFHFGSLRPEGVNRLPVEEKKPCDECL